MFILCVCVGAGGSSAGRLKSFSQPTSIPRKCVNQHQFCKGVDRFLGGGRLGPLSTRSQEGSGSSPSCFLPLNITGRERNSPFRCKPAPVNIWVLLWAEQNFPPNSYVEAPVSQEHDCLGDKVFQEITKLKWGHMMDFDPIRPVSLQEEEIQIQT